MWWCFGTDSDCVSVCLHDSQGSDATSSNVWQETSLLSTYTKTEYITPISIAGAPTGKRAGFADLQRVLWKSAEGLRSLLDKQLRSVGIPRAWDANYSDDANVLRQYMYCSDGGPEQKKYKKDRKVRVSNLPQTFWLDFDCMMHGGQLSVRSGLRVADAWSARQGLSKHVVVVGIIALPRAPNQ